MFIIPDTVPEYSPAVSMGTDQDGPMVHSRKNAAPVKQYTAAWASSTSAASRMNPAQPNMPTIATERRANLVLPVLWSSQSVANPPTVLPTTIAQSGSD